MPTIGEIANQAFSNGEVLSAQLEGLRTRIDSLELIALRDRVTSLEAMVAELKRIKEESEKKRSQWIFWGIGVLVTLTGTFAVQLLLNWIKK